VAEQVHQAEEEEAEEEVEVAAHQKACSVLVLAEAERGEALFECLLIGSEEVVEPLLVLLKGAEVWILEEHWFLVVVGAPLLSMYSPLLKQPRLRHVCR